MKENTKSQLACPKLREVLSSARFPSRLAVLLSVLLCADSVGFAKEPEGGPSFTVHTAVEWALEHNPQILIARQVLTELKGRVREEKAEAFPKLDFLYSYGRFRDPGILNSSSFNDISTDFPFDLTPEAQNLFDMSFSLEQTLYKSGKIATGLQIARLAVSSSHEALQTVAADVSLQVAQGFYNALLAQQVQAALETSVSHAKRNLEVTENRVEVGEATRLDLLRARAALAQLGPQLVEADQGIRETKSLLNRLLGRAVNAPLQLAGGFASVDEAIPGADQILKTALDARHEIRKLKIDKDILIKRDKYTKTDLKPSVTMNGSLGTSTAFARNMLDSDFLSWRVAVDLRIPILDGGRVKGLLAQNRAQLAQAELALLDAQGGVELEVELARNRIGRALERIEATRTALDAATEAFRVAEELYEVGAATSLEILDFERERRAADLEHKRAFHEYSLALAKLKRTMEIPVYGAFEASLEPGG